MDFTTGQVVTAAQMDTLSHGTLAYAQITANQASINAITDITGLSVTATLVSGRRYKITVHTIAFASTVGTDEFQVRITDAANTRVNATNVTATSNGNGVDLTHTFVAGSSASHTFKARASRVAGTGTGTFTASADAPGFILLEDIGNV